MFDYVTVEKAEERIRGGQRKERARTNRTRGGGKAKKGRKVMARIWSDLVKGLKKEDKLETTNSDKSGNGSEKSDLVEPFDSQEPNQLKVKRSKRHQKNQGKVKWSTRALREDKPTEKVETHGIGGVKKCWTGGVEERGTRPNMERKQGVEMRGRVGC